MLCSVVSLSIMSDFSSATHSSSLLVSLLSSCSFLDDMLSWSLVFKFSFSSIMPCNSVSLSIRLAFNSSMSAFFLFNSASSSPSLLPVSDFICSTSSYALLICTVL
ncbi:hypothetical protein V8G54_024238 [Vigna mungo]|uniref:Uncharacterized protein n=1 Tax=Vigna mungo TaxID=3915 RepID=A0AAQ3N5W6_VIGMU